MGAKFYCLKQVLSYLGILLCPQCFSQGLTRVSHQSMSDARRITQRSPGQGKLLSCVSILSLEGSSGGILLATLKIPALRCQECYCLCIAPSQTHTPGTEFHHLHVSNFMWKSCIFSRKQSSCAYAIKIPSLFIHFLLHSQPPYCMPWCDVKKLFSTTPPPGISSFEIQHDITNQKDICHLVKSYFYCKEPKILITLK